MNKILSKSLPCSYHIWVFVDNDVDEFFSLLLSLSLLCFVKHEMNKWFPNVYSTININGQDSNCHLNSSIYIKKQLFTYIRKESRRWEGEKNLKLAHYL